MIGANRAMIVFVVLLGSFISGIIYFAPRATTVDFIPTGTKDEPLPGSSGLKLAVGSDKLQIFVDWCKRYGYPNTCFEPTEVFLNGKSVRFEKGYDHKNWRYILSLPVVPSTSIKSVEVKFVVKSNPRLEFTARWQRVDSSFVGPVAVATSQ